jgi:hypothetical protein
MDNKTTRFPGVLYIVLSSVALLIWLGFLFFALFLGGSPGPDYERTVPFMYVGIMALGLVGAVLGIAAGKRGLGAKPAGKALPICAALFGAIGSLSFFLMELAPVGLFALLPGILPSLLYLLLTRKREKG